tara:strand:- start:28 stop:363 length:336 start_codon:yes stop_codon:yes gene_type:complete
MKEITNPKKLVDMNELENALAIVKNASDILIEESELRRKLLNTESAYVNKDECQELYNREESGSVVDVIAALEVIKHGNFKSGWADIRNIDNRVEQIKDRIKLKAKSIRCW